MNKKYLEEIVRDLLDKKALYIDYVHKRKIVIFFIDENQEHKPLFIYKFKNSQKASDNYETHAFEIIRFYNQQHESFTRDLCFANVHNPNCPTNMTIEINYLCGNTIRFYSQSYSGGLIYYGVSVPSASFLSGIIKQKYVDTNHKALKSMKKIMQKYEERVAKLCEIIDDLYWSPEPGPGYKKSLEGFNKALNEATQG